MFELVRGATTTTSDVIVMYTPHWHLKSETKEQFIWLRKWFQVNNHTLH